MTRFCFLRSAFVLALLTFTSVAALAQLPAPPNSVMSDIKPGSVLFYPKYTSNPSSPQSGDTQINMTNVSQNLGISVHLFLIDGSTCSIADAYTSLTPNQTTSFLLSDFDPGITGYLVAVASESGPVQHNFLIGSEYIRETDGRFAFLPAYTVAKISNAPVPLDENGNALLTFNGADYERLPSSLALSSFNSQTIDSTQVNILSPGNDLITGTVPSTNSLFSLVYDDSERAFSTTVRVVCYNTFNLTSLRVAGGGAGGLNTLVPAGRTGWIRFSTTSRPILGCMISRGPIFNGGHNLHVIGLLSSYTIMIPNF